MTAQKTAAKETSEHVNCLDICLQVRFLSDTFQASIVSFFGNILFNSTL